jgi:hypothetical protein
MKTSRGSVRWVGVLTGVLATAPGARAQVVHTENFETGGLGAYSENTFGGVNSLWHGDAYCGDIPVSSGCLDNVTSAVQSMPFPFSFFGSSATQYRANTNGFVIMNGTGSTGDTTGDSAFNTLPGSPTPPDNLVCPWWDNQVLTVVGTSKISSLLSGTPGSQVLTVQWTSNSMLTSTPCPFNDGSNLSYQVKFYEATGAIEFHYNTAGFVGGSSARSASVGAEALGATGWVGVDATGLGAGNSAFPATDLRLTPSGGTYTVSAIAPSWSSIVGVPGATTLLTAAAPGAFPMPASFGTNAASYNRGDQNPPVYDYSTGGPNAGAIESPVFAVPAVALDVTVTYDSHREMETGFYDQTLLEARAGGSSFWGVVVQQITNSTCSAGPTTITVSNGVTQTLAGGGGGQIRFRVNTVDAVANQTDGWSVDNISVAVTPVPGIVQMAPPAPCPGSGGCVPVIGWIGGAPSVSAGVTFALTLSQARASSPVVLAIGASSGVPFPIDLGLILGGGPCYLMNNAGMILSGLSTTASSTGAPACVGTLSVPINLAGASPGGPIFAQFFVIDPASPLSGLPVVASDQLSVTVLP